MTESFSLLNAPASQVAPRLLGCDLVRTLNNRSVRLRIVETEAYDQNDVASHSYKGRTNRTAVMFGPAGHLYVYFTYGMHYCCNIVVGPEAHGSAVLIRALQPIAGDDLIALNRPKASGINLTNGPAKLCQALQIDKRLNGHDLNQPPLQLIIKPKISQDAVVQTKRVGISQAQDTPWRFYIKDNDYVSLS